MTQATNRFTKVKSLLVVDPAAVDKSEASRGASPDALIVDVGGPGKLSTAVRDARRTAAGAFLNRMRGRAYRPLLIVRIAPLTAAWSDGDLQAVMPALPDAILLSACPDAAMVQNLGVRLGVAEATLGVAEGTTAIIAEAGALAAGLVALPHFAGASPRLAAMTWDAAALSQDVGGSPGVFTEDEGARGVVRVLLALGARAAAVPLYDTAVPGIGEAFGRDCATARRLGFCGRVSHDPAQVATINTLFGSGGTAARVQSA